MHCLTVTPLVVTGSNGTFTSAFMCEALGPVLDAWQVLAIDELMVPFRESLSTWCMGMSGDCVLHNKC